MNSIGTSTACFDILDCSTMAANKQALSSISVYENFAVGITLVVLSIRLCLMPIGSSLSLDETGTFWVIQGSLPQTVARAQSLSPQSGLYMAIVWMFQAAVGSSEVALRLPSLMAYSLGGVMLYRIGKRLLDSPSALTALVVFVALTSRCACDARPYALALFLGIAATWYVIRWLDRGNLSDGSLFAILSALTVYCHFLFGTMAIVSLLYAVFRIRFGSPVTWYHLAVVTVVLILCVAPLTPQLLVASTVRSIWSSHPAPSLSDLFENVAPPFLAVSVLSGALACAVLLPGFRYFRAATRSGDLILMLLGAGTAPLLLFFVSRITGLNIFQTRYFSSAAPGIALLTAWAIRGFEPRRARIVLTFAIAFSALLVQGGVQLKVRHDRENWRDAIAAARAASGNMPILVRSGFDEAPDPKSYSGPSKARLVLTPLVAYPLTGRVIRLPNRASPQAFRDLDAAIPEVLGKGGGFLLVSSWDETAYLNWLEGRLYTAGFRSRSLGDFGALSVHVFERLAR